jgi:hypothetical protein
MKALRVALITPMLLLVACVSATPVKPAPIAPEEEPKMKAALVGTCHVVMTQAPGGAPREDKGIHLTFQPEGKLHYRIESPVGDVTNDSTYRLEGRNVVSDGIYKTMRVDEYSDQKLLLFVYDISKIFHCTKDQKV